MSLESRDTQQPQFEELLFESVKSHEELDLEVVEGIVQCVIESGFDTTREDILNHMSGDRILILRDSYDGVISAFSNTSFVSPNEHYGRDDISDSKACYLAGGTIHGKKQNKGLYKKLNQRRIELGLEQGYDLIFTTTQNPYVEAGIKGALTEMQMKGQIKGYNMDERVYLPGHYGKMMTLEKPLHKDIEYDINYEAGDAYALLFHLQGNSQ